MQYRLGIYRSLVWTCKLTHFCSYPAPGPRTSGNTTAGPDTGGDWAAFKTAFGEIPVQVHLEESPGIKASKACQGHWVSPTPRAGPPASPPTCLPHLGCCSRAALRPAPLHRGYLGTGQSGKHLIATLRKGDVRNKGNCVGSWELPFPGNGGSQTKP